MSEEEDRSQEEPTQEPQDGAFLFDTDLDVYGPERRHWVEGLVLLAAGTGGLVSYFALGVAGGLLGVFGLLFGLMSMRLVRTTNVLKQQVSANERGLWIDGHLAYRRERIQAGVFQPHEVRKMSAVRLLGRHGETLFEARVESRQQAKELLQALGVDSQTRRVELKGLSPLVSVLPRALGLVAMLALVLIAALGGYAKVAMFMLPALVPLVFLAALSSRITIGTDGVLVQWLNRKRFIPFDQIEDVRENGKAGLVIHLRSGENFVLTGASAQGELATRDRNATVARLLEQLQSRLRSPMKAGDLAELLRRAGRSQKEWAEGLKKLGADDGAVYRSTAAVRSDDLLRIIEDSTAPEDARAGAAYLLREDTSARDRVRIAAEASASPTLRVALAAASEEEEEQEEESILKPFSAEE